MQIRYILDCSLVVCEEPILTADIAFRNSLPLFTFHNRKRMFSYSNLPLAMATTQVCQIGLAYLAYVSVLL